MGLRIEKSAEYRTMPRGLRGASSMSVITALRESFGSTSPNAVPSSISYCPTVPNEAPPKAGEVRAVMTSWVIRASAGSVMPESATTSTMKTVLGMRCPPFEGYESTATLSEHVARFGLVDIQLHIFRQKEALLLQLLGGLPEGLHVAVVVLVPLFERPARVAGGETFRLGPLERDVLAVRFAAFVFAEPGSAQGPSGGGGDRRFHLRQAHAGDLVCRLLLVKKKDRVGRASF